MNANDNRFRRNDAGVNRDADAHAVRRPIHAATHPVTIVHDGRPYSGRYTVAKGMVTVTTTAGSRAARLAGHSAERLAAILLADLVRRIEAQRLEHAQSQPQDGARARA